MSPPLQGADLVECDVTITKDLVLICSHEPWIGDISNVESNNIGGPQHADFSDRKTTYNMDDADPDADWNDKGDVTDFFAVDFTLEEIRTLRRKQVRRRE
jgi:glycerophosphoryl diester phosphodiesterase